MKQWLKRVVSLDYLEESLNELERATDHPAGPPIITYIDQTRIIILWPYLYVEKAPDAPTV